MSNLSDEIQKILQKGPTAPAASSQEEGDKFFSILLGEGLHENFLEFRFKEGMRTCFSYQNLSWFNYDPESRMLDLEFDGYLVTLQGRGLGERLYDGIKSKRISWIKEADVALQDHPGNQVYIEKILITPPADSGQEEASE